MISIYEFADVIDTNLKLIRQSNRNNRWIVRFEYSEIKEGMFLTGSYGSGSSPAEAILDYVQKIKGKLLVINATSKEYRKEFQVPKDLYVVKGQYK